MSLPEPVIPPAVVDKCFIQYSPSSPPSLYEVPIALGDLNSNTSIGLAPGLLSRAVASIAGAFASCEAGSPLVGNNNLDKNTLPVIVICSPHLNSLVAVDAAVRYIAHSVEADMVILDPADLAAGRQGVFGDDLTDAFWQLYNYHYQGSKSDSDDSDSEEPVPDSDKSGSEEPGSAKVDDSDPSFARAEAFVRKFFLMQSGASESTPSRRRILYLRDYSSLCKAMSPLLPVLYDAASSSSPTIVVAGISPIQRVVAPEDTPRNVDHTNFSLFQLPSLEDRRLSRKRTQYKRFLEKLEGGEFMSYLRERYSPTWRKPSRHSNGRYHSLEDIFTSTFINRYQGKGIGSRMGGSVSLRGLSNTQLQFTCIIRVGLLRDPPQTVQDVSQNERRKRFLLANLKLVYDTAKRQNKIFELDIGNSVDQGSNLKTLIKAESSVLNDEQVKHIVDTLPSPAKSADLLDALCDTVEHASDTEWRDIMHTAKSGRSPQSNGQRTVDPILERVRADSSLSSEEKQLLSNVIDPITIRTTFADVYVKPEVTETLRTAVSYPILFPEEYNKGILAQESMGGVLLFGPPGTGKTMACRALAKECGARMLQIQASTIQRCYVGDTEKLISAAFSLARRLGPCVLFIDEVDALFCKRDDGSKQWHRTMVTEFTQEMDGLNTADANQRSGLIVIGATNRPQDIDSAVVRRLSRRILVDLPAVQQRKAIITHYLKGEEYDKKTVNIAKLASRTTLFSGSDLRHLVHAAALASLRDVLPSSYRIKYDSDGAPIPESSCTLMPRIIQGKHFDQALKQVAASSATNRKELDELRSWANELFQSNYCT